MLYKNSFQILAELISNCYQHQRMACGKMTTTCCKRFFLRVCDMCLSHFRYYLFLYCVLYGTWIPDGGVDFIFCTTNWFIQISLEFWKWLLYKDFVLKILNYYQNYHDHQENNLQFLLVREFEFSLFNFFNSFCKDWTTGLRCFCLLKGAEQMFFGTFSSRVSFLQCSAFCPLPCFCD